MNIPILILNGLTYGGLLFMGASGLTLIMGLMGIVNMAHGTYYLLGAYVGWALVRAGMSWYMAILISGLLIAVISYLVRVGLFRFVMGQGMRMTMLTIGISLIIWYHRDKRRALALIQAGYYVTAEIIGFPINRRHRINNIPMYYVECIYRDPMTGKEYYFQSGDIGLVTNRMVNHQNPPQNQTVRVYVDPNHDYRNYYVDIDSIR